MSKLTPIVSDRDHVQGDASARVTLVEYGDYECPYCGQAYPIVKAIQRRLGAHLRFVFRNFPLREAHPFAEGAAEAAEAAGSQGSFWEMHDLLFENQEDLEGESLVRYAQRVVSDAERWVRDMNNRAFRERVDEDFKSGMRSGVNGTPTFFINGVRHDGSFDEATLEQAIRAHL
jgi:protein-disulfide isomerase